MPKGFAKPSSCFKFNELDEVVKEAKADIEKKEQDEKAAAELIHDGIRGSQAPGEAGGATTEEQKKVEEDDDPVMEVPLAGTGVVVLPSQAAGRGGRQKKDKGKGGRKGAQSQRGGKKQDKQSSGASSVVCLPQPRVCWDALAQLNLRRAPRCCAMGFDGPPPHGFPP